MALINCPNCKKSVWDGASECPNCKCNVKERLAEIKKLEEKKKRLEQVCPECKNIPSKSTYYRENKKYYGWDDPSGKLTGYTEITILKCSNCGWETEIHGDSYGFLFDGADINRPGTKDHQIYKKIFCKDCGKELFHGKLFLGLCPDCQLIYSKKNNNDYS
ncbi:hypothetical protein [Treponema sp. R6D11]